MHAAKRTAMIRAALFVTVKDNMNELCNTRIIHHARDVNSWISGLDYELST